MAKISINMQQGNVQSTDVIVGIDLGTTNSLVAFVKGGLAQTVKDQSGQQAIVPSVIYFDEKDQPLVGETAKDYLVEQPSRTIYSVKRLLGKSYQDMRDLQDHFSYEVIDSDDEALVKVQIGKRFYNPIELSAIILKALKERAEHELGQQVSKAVITVPAYFNDAQRQATRDAGKLAGLDVLRIINEPTAASLAYGLDSGSKAQTVAIYDLGGGTFDVSILRLEEGIFEVLATNGDTMLGGDDFDRLIVSHWIKELGLSQQALSRKQRQELRVLAELAKVKLSTEETINIRSSHGELSLNRKKFHELVFPLIEKTVSHCQQALHDAQLSKQDIDHIVMVGGSSRIPLVKSSVSDYFEKQVHDELNPDEVVAIGAAIQADVLAGNNKDILLLDITPLSLGIETVGGLMDVIIPRNSKIPMGAGRQYTTSVDGQKNLKVAIYQGERDLVEHNRKLGEFILRDIPPMPAGLPKIDIAFTIDADGILKVNAKELRSETEQTIEVRPAYGITEEEMARMLKDSISHAQEDVRIKAIKEAQNEANHILAATDKFIAQNEHWLSSSQKAMIHSLAEELRKKASEDDKDAINLAIEKLNSYSRPLAEKAMDIAISSNLKGNKI